MGKILKKVLIVFLAVLVSGVFANPIYALSNKYLDAFSQNNILFYDPDEALGGGVGGCYSGDLSGDTIMAKVVSYLKGNNPTGFVLSDNGIAGILASFEAESGFNPFRFQGDQLSGPAYGIAQFDPMSKITNKLMSDNRTSSYFNEYFDLKYTSYDSSTGLPTESVPMEVVDAWLLVQLDYFFGPGSEFETIKVGDYRDIGETTMGLDYISDSMSPHEAMNAAQSPADAARIFVWIMERPAHKEDDSYYRGEIAKKWLNYVETFSGGSSSGSGGSSSAVSDGNNVTIIGDSVIVVSNAKIKEKLPQAAIYAQDGKQLDNVLSDVQNLVNSDKLRDIVIFAVGTDSSVNKEQVDELVKIVGNSRKIVFVLNNSANDDYLGNNNIFKKVAESNSNVSVVDWNSDKKLDFFESNGVTPNSEGQEALASVVVSAAGQAESTREDCIGGAIEGGLTMEQAQKLADYYNSDAVDPYEWGFYAGTKVNCTAFSWWFAEYFTGLSWGNGDAKNVAHNFAVAHGLPEGNEPRPFAIFAVDGPPLAFSQDCDGYCGHTGIVVAVEGDKVITVEAAWGAYSGMVKVHDKSDFINNTWGTAYTYLDSVIDVNKLNAIIGN